MSQLSANIEKLGPAHAILHGEIHFEILSLKILRKLLRSRRWSDLQTFGIKMTALIFDSDFQISRLVARESEMNDFWRNFVERHQVTGSI